MTDPETAILVLGALRPLVLENTLESLRRQRAIKNVQVWLDGHYGFAGRLPVAYACRAAAERFPEARLVAYNGHVGISKLMLDALRTAAEENEWIIVLEDDCFPTAYAIDVFRHELDQIAGQPGVYSVYGHHFLLAQEGCTISRFQPWGWATTRTKLLPVLRQLESCLHMSEPEFLAWVQRQVTADVRARLAVTPPRNPLDTLSMFFSWAACTALITAAMGLEHKKTERRVIFNCGLGPDSGHFEGPGPFRDPPFNMIAPHEVWKYFEA